MKDLSTANSARESFIATVFSQFRMLYTPNELLPAVSLLIDLLSQNQSPQLVDRGVHLPLHHIQALLLPSLRTEPVSIVYPPAGGTENKIVDPVRVFASPCRSALLTAEAFQTLLVLASVKPSLTLSPLICTLLAHVAIQGYASGSAAMVDGFEVSEHAMDFMMDASFPETSVSRLLRYIPRGSDDLGDTVADRACILSLMLHLSPSFAKTHGDLIHGMCYSLIGDFFHTKTNGCR